MAKRKPSHSAVASAGISRSAEYKQNGLKAFRRNDFTTAIKEWSRIDPKTDPVVNRALAEVYFRRGLVTWEPQQRVADLTHATELIPGEGRYWYHLGLAHHRADHLADACTAYARAAEAGFSRHPLAFARGLAEIERNPNLNQATLDALAAGDSTPLLPIAALLRDAPQVILKAETVSWFERLRGLARGDAMSALWRGLALLAVGQVGQAAEVLVPVSNQTLPADAEAVRRLYRGIALAASGNQPAARAEWAEAPQRGTSPRLQSAVADAHLAQITTALAAEQWQEVIQAAESVFALTGPALDQPKLLAATLVAHHRLANEAADRGAWAEAISHWSAMRDLLALSSAAGQRAPILHNLAIAHENLEQWELAAEAWEGLMSALPRRQAKAKAGAALPADRVAALPVAEKRTWLRHRIMDCYKKAGQPDLAIKQYRAAIKATPDDLDLRLEMADALLANEQEIAARNELERILERDPKHAAARIKLAELHVQRGESYLAEHQLRELVKDEPTNQAARRGLTDILRSEAHGLFNAGMYQPAKEAYKEALSLTPDDANLLASLGYTEIVLGNEPAARSYFDTALARGTVEAYQEVIERWASHGNLEEVRSVLARAEVAGVATPHFYISVAASCLRATPTPEPDFLDFLSPPTKKKQPKALLPANPWDALGKELLQKAETTGGNRPDVLQHIVAEFATTRPEIALPYTERLVALTPDDPVVLMGLAFAQAAAERKREAKETLRKAAVFARQQNNSQLAREIDQLRKAIDDPMFGLMSRMLPFMNDLDFDEDFFV